MCVGFQLERFRETEIERDKTVQFLSEPLLSKMMAGHGNTSICDNLQENPNTAPQLIFGVVLAFTIQIVIHLPHHFIRIFMLNIPPGSKTALAEISILTSTLLELQVTSGLLPFGLRLVTGYFSLEVTVFWSYTITAIHLGLTTCLSSFVLLRILYIFFFNFVNSFSDENIALGRRGERLNILMRILLGQ